MHNWTPSELNLRIAHTLFAHKIKPTRFLERDSTAEEDHKLASYVTDKINTGLISNNKGIYSFAFFKELFNNEETLRSERKEFRSKIKEDKENIPSTTEHQPVKIPVEALKLNALSFRTWMVDIIKEGIRGMTDGGVKEQRKSAGPISLDGAKTRLWIFMTIPVSANTIKEKKLEPGQRFVTSQHLGFSFSILTQSYGNFEI
ncbi:hypothetical protein WN51_14427 [Melipona quadrifasciata]|uniref:Uncharacterized protein n=1 Tax=Melipona quadrifasciata TaxID=166423 RepID=A0A0N0BFI5_9HYME|nr:hypothetical protein WN51_14427 [Melipona quadrifasciata]